MRTITLIRHAKSSWEGDISDVYRPLSEKGIRDANLLSNELLKYHMKPDAIFSSPANRALTTCKTFMATLNYSPDLLSVTDELYDFGGRQVINFIRSIKDSYENVFLFGHNHAFTEITNSFGDTYVDNVPTCGLVVIEFNTDVWKNIDKGHTKMILFPKHLKS